MRGLAQKVFDETIENERRKKGIPEYVPKQYLKKDTPTVVDEEIDEDIEFK